MPALTEDQIRADPSRHGHYGGRKKGGRLCAQHVIKGTKTCRMHPGPGGVAALKAKGQVLVDAQKWGLGDTNTDPGDYLLRLVSQSAWRVDRYGRQLGEAYEAAEHLRSALRAEELLIQRPDQVDEGDDDQPPHPALQAAWHDLRRIFTTGGTAALIGFKYDATKDGMVYATEEAIRGLAQLELQERKFGADIAAKAVAAGLAERMVRLAERQGALMAQFVVRVAERLGLTDVQQAALPGAIEAEVINMTEGAAA